MNSDKAFKVFSFLALTFLFTLLPAMVLAYYGNEIALTYCNGLESFSSFVLGGTRSALYSVMSR